MNLLPVDVVHWRESFAEASLNYLKQHAFGTFSGIETAILENCRKVHYSFKMKDIISKIELKSH